MTTLIFVLYSIVNYLCIMEIGNKKIILASASPRRRELLEGMGVQFTVDTKNSFDEVYDESTPKDLIPSVLSKGKSYGFHRDLEEGEILITSDTLVLCDDVVMGKPHSYDEAVQMLRMLSGRSHKVITAITIRDNKKCRTSSDTTFVNFKPLSESEIDFYISNYKPFDKAGAYGIQEWIGYIGIDRIEGSYFTVMGFPVHLVYSELQYFLD